MTFRPRRQYASQANWGRAFGAFSFALVGVTFFLHRRHIIDLDSFLFSLSIAFLMAIIAILYCIWALIRIWKKGIHGGGSALFGVFWSIPAIILPIIVAIMINHYPPLHDLATDIINPPQFKTLHPLKSHGTRLSFPNSYAASDREIIETAYPGLTPHHYDMAYTTVFDAAHAAIKELGWKEYITSQPQNEGEGNRLEAETTSPILGFRGGISIRIREKKRKIIVDVRAVTFGLKYDFGIAHKQINDFWGALDSYLEKLEES